MKPDEFCALEYYDKLTILNKAGRLEYSFTLDEYQFSLYEIKDFYVELKRNLNELFFDRIVAMNYEDLPAAYKDFPPFIPVSFSGC